MRRNRVDCANCTRFKFPVYKDEHNLISPIKTDAKCKLGKRVMFRMPKTVYDDYGWFRYCEDFNDKRNES